MAATKDKERIVALQKQLKIARDTLTRISSGHYRPYGIAYEALDEMNRIEWNSRPTPLQGLVGHG